MLLAIGVTLLKLMPLIVFVPLVAFPVKDIFCAFVVIDPAPELFVNEREAKVSLLVDVVKLSENLPEESVRFPDVMVSLPEVKVRSPCVRVAFP